MTTNIYSLKHAISLVGTQQAFADAISEESGRSLTQKAVSRWIVTENVPLHWLIHIERVTGVPCHAIDPYHYPPPKWAS